jgi:RimJ/RimL family protein N-acetyltransferase
MCPRGWDIGVEKKAFPDAVLNTSRLTLRPFVEADIEAVQEGAADSSTQKWLPLPRPYTASHARAWCLELAPAVRTAGLGLVRAVESEGRLVGSIDLKRTDWMSGVTEIGYWTAPGWRRRGVMTEATKALALWVLDDMGFERVELRIATGNVASLRVAARAGFTREGVARSAG